MDKLCVVQFLHPGGEHEPDQPDGRSWNRGNHKRTFMRCYGTYEKGNGLATDDLVFWGEWEPPVQIVDSNPAAQKGYPRYVCKPYLKVLHHFEKHQNTDPFVFGDRFLYSICQQNTKWGPTGMQELDHGSLILFGSHRGGRFCLDTLFVVSRGTRYTGEDYHNALDGIAPPIFVEAVLKPWHASDGIGGGSRSRCRLYEGATPADSVSGMFSFFPCLPRAQGSSGFARPVISLPQYIKDTSRQGRRVTVVSDLDRASKVWREVTDQVRASGLLLGVQADLPEVRD